MLVVKRYANRKLYDTVARQYISLEGVAELVRQGRDVQVVDHGTGEDLTALTLAQIICEQEKKRAGFLPRPLLAGLVQAGGLAPASLQRSLAACLDLAHLVEAEIEGRVRDLAGRGELDEEQAARLRGLLLPDCQPGPAAQTLAEGAMKAFLLRYGVPTRADIRQIAERVETLMAQLDEVSDHATIPDRKHLNE